MTISSILLQAQDGEYGIGVGLGALPLMILIVVVIYLIIIRSRMRRQKELKNYSNTFHDDVQSDVPNSEQEQTIIVNHGQSKRCPYCGEEILAAAKKCKHCGEWLTVSTQSIKPKTPTPKWLYYLLALGFIAAGTFLYVNKSDTNSPFSFSPEKDGKKIGEEVAKKRCECSDRYYIEGSLSMELFAKCINEAEEIHAKAQEKYATNLQKLIEFNHAYDVTFHAIYDPCTNRSFGK